MNLRTTSIPIQNTPYGFMLKDTAQVVVSLAVEAIQDLYADFVMEISLGVIPELEPIF